MRACGTQAWRSNSLKPGTSGMRSRPMPVKTDRKDARGIAELMRMGWFRPVHCKSISAQETRAILTTRTLIEAKLRDVEMSLRGVLRGFGLKVGKTTPTNFAERIKELVSEHA